MHISPYFSLYLLSNRQLLLEGLLALLLLLLLVLLVLPGRLPLYNSPPPPHETSGGSTSIAEELGMVEVPYPPTNYEEEEREKGWEGAGCGYVSCKHTRKKDKCKFTHLRIGT
jgi:hypothetical protein